MIKTFKSKKDQFIQKFLILPFFFLILQEKQFSFVLPCAYKYPFCMVTCICELEFKDSLSYVVISRPDWDT